MNLQDKFSQFLKEDTADAGQAYGRAMVGAPPGIPSVDDVVMGDPWNVEKPEMFHKLNAYLSAASASPVMNPYFLLKRIQDKLSQIGLNFEMPKLVGETGTVSKKINQFGGAFGYENPTGMVYKPGETGSVNFPKIGKNDGLEHRIPGGLDLRVHWTCHKGFYTLEVELVKGKSKPEKIQEDDKKKIKGDLKESENLDDPHEILHSHGWKVHPDSGGASPKAYQHSAHKGHTIFVSNNGDITHNTKDKTLFSGKNIETHLMKFHGYGDAPHNDHKMQEDFNDDVPMGGIKVKKTPIKNDPPMYMSTDPIKKSIHNDPAVLSGKIRKGLAKEENIDEVSPPGWSATVKAMKRHRKIENPFSLAWYMKKHGDRAHYAIEK